jgi:hypothetical protein
LERSIGPTGMLAVRPLLSQTPRDLWQMHQLGQGATLRRKAAHMIPRETRRR